MRASQPWKACVVATLLILSKDSAVALEDCEGCRGETWGNLQSSEDATSLLQVRHASTLRSDRHLIPMAAPQTTKFPVFRINLDDPPKKRFVEVARYYSKELPIILDTLQKAWSQQFGNDAKDIFVKSSGVRSYPDYLEEINGVVEAVKSPKVTSDSLIMAHMLYELDLSKLSKTTSSSLLFVGPDDQVLHGCSFDSTLQWSWNHSSYHYPQDVTHELHFYKGNQSLYNATQWLPAGGISFASRLDGWSFAQHGANNKNHWKDNLVAAKDGGLSYTFAARHIMETTPDFEAALKKLSETKFMAPSYFVLSGAKPWQGAVLSVDRLGKREKDTAPIQFIRQMKTEIKDHKTIAHKNVHFLAQTNDPPLDEIGSDSRRFIVDAMVKQLPQDFMNTTNMINFVHDTPMFTITLAATPFSHPPITQYQNVMLPKSGFYKTMLQYGTDTPKMDYFGPTRLSAFQDWKTSSELRKPTEFVKSFQRGVKSEQEKAQAGAKKFQQKVQAGVKQIENAVMSEQEKARAKEFQENVQADVKQVENAVKSVQEKDQAGAKELHEKIEAGVKHAEKGVESFEDNVQADVTKAANVVKKLQEKAQAPWKKAESHAEKIAKQLHDFMYR